MPKLNDVYQGMSQNYIKVNPSKLEPTTATEEKDKVFTTDGARISTSPCQNHDIKHGIDIKGYPVISEVMSFKAEDKVILDSSKGLKGCSFAAVHRRI